ncbi:AraC family transcriptional regulator [Gilvimarinus polysaccharolyticus]|uniref:AraC family transcriptional regulator n=1 Tax=Gilvimarinus polysaccharolyticus TaxID=863921 RepID=UPI000A04D258|nr:helix-turn-helix domain-containing protein [Gilvimarinus polysaccharolyticus]
MSDRIFNIHDIFLIVAILEALLIASYRWAQPSSGRRNSYLLIAFLVVVVTDMATNLIMWNEYFPVPQVVRDRILPVAFCLSHFARGPLFYFYVRSLLYKSVPFRPVHLIHMLPAVVAVVVVLATNLMASDLQQRLGGTTISTLASFLWYSSSALSVAYVVWSITTLYLYMHRAKQHMSDFSGSEVILMVVLSSCFIISWGWSIVVVISADLVGGVFADAVGTSHNFIRFALMNALIFFILIYTGRLVSLEPEAPTQEDHVATDSVLQAIQQGINTKQLHLQPSINIDQFSENIGLPVRVVSHAINRHLGTRFFELINSHRIEEAKRLLADPTANDMTILDVLLASGFNNKSSFHRFFNRLVGTSPSDFRRCAQRATAK